MSAEREGLRARVERTLDQAEAHIRDRSFSYASAAIANAKELLALLDSEPEPDARYVVVIHNTQIVYQGLLDRKSAEQIRDHYVKVRKNTPSSVRILPVGPVPRAEPLVYLRRKMVDAIMEDLREGESGIVADHMWLNPDVEDIAVRDLVPLYVEPAPRPAQEEDDG